MENARRTASDTSSIHSSGSGITAYAERTLSSTSNLPTPRSSLGNSLTVCTEGAYIGILMSGMVDKRREGAVRAGFARRLFLLSIRGCHYYRKADEAEIFGTERGQIGLRDFSYTKIVPEGEAPYGTIEPGVQGYFIGLFSKQHTLTWFLRVDSHEAAKTWVMAISAAQEVAKKNLYPVEWTPEMHNQYTAIVTGIPIPPQPKETEKTVDGSIEESVPSILAISMCDGDDRERLLSRKIEMQKDISLGSLTLREYIHILLSDRSVITILPSTYLTPSSLVSSTVISHARPDGKLTRVHVSLSATKALARPKITTHPDELILPVQYNAAALGFSALYISSCLLAYLFGPPFQGIMQVTVIMGFFLSISVVASGFIRFQSTKVLAASTQPVEAQPKLFNVTMNISAIENVQIEKQPESDETSIPEDVEPQAPLPPEVREMAFSQRFIAAEKGNEEKGRERFQKTLQWRRENQVDGMLYVPQPHFHLIKSNYPQYFHGKSLKGHCVYYERIGKINLKAMKEAGLTMDELLRHYIYLTEYMWTNLEPSDSGRSVTVLDVDGIGFYDLTGDVTDFVRQAMGFVSANYPERSAQIFIVNVPSWFNMLWKVFSPMIDPVTKEKIRICKGKAVKEELLKSIAESELPSDYGGSGPPLGQSKEELDLFKHVDDILHQHK